MGLGRYVCNGNHVRKKYQLIKKQDHFSFKLVGYNMCAIFVNRHSKSSGTLFNKSTTKAKNSVIGKMHEINFHRSHIYSSMGNSGDHKDTYIL